ncbi:non-ribosomal peptide synthetase [Phormidium tenue]|uniref:Non-ribosomal peptide synthetase n=1 Tax=Phormidium tenue NIES-30 TaxID=549789 RepID=A0A1U7IYR8_9CYAN|nr:non-ribosomal peptide synthetase [Phormidium tenue]MBD2234787.1 non-ribosomal peptide synthetase [Phormidium tenue FACHB-1052]OKH43881.1 non-ribosomal peptide synthetase [Phormidium tenue NIES-30]
MTNRAIADFISHLHQLDIKLSIETDPTVENNQTRLRCNAPEGTLTPALRQELTDRKAELITYLQINLGSGELHPKDSFPSTHSPSHTSTSPLSFAQQRLWFLYQLAPHNPFYNVPAAIHLKGALDRSALERSLQEIVHRHAALRTRFTTVDGQPVQVVEPNANVELAVVNLQAVAISERDRIRQQLAAAEAQRPFNLTTDSLVRMTLLHFDAAESVLLLTMHHIVADGWSLGILIRELGYFYTAFVEDRSPTLPPLPIQYADFARWQHNWLQGEVLEKQLSYWRQQLQDLPVLELPSDRPRPAVQTYRGATYPVHISPALSQALETFSQQSGTSLFMTLLAAFQTLLYRYTGQEDIAIGTPIANRHRSEVEGLIGFFVNSLVMRSELSGNPTFRELLEQVRQVALGAYEHQDLPFEKLVEELDPDRDLSRNPLFQVAFALQNAPMQPLDLPALTLEPAPLDSASTRFDLEVHLWEPAHGLKSFWRSQDGLGGFISYSTDLFDRDRIARLVGHFKTLLEGIVANPDARLSDLPLLTPEENQQILHDWSGCLKNGKTGSPAGFSHQEKTSVEASPVKEIVYFHHFVEAYAKQTPKTIALVTEFQTLTYQALDRQADQLGQSLRKMRVQPNSLVGLCVDRSADMVIGILGILKAGGAYVPLDPTYPSDRLQFILNDTQVSILLTQSWLTESLPATSATIVCLDQPLCPHSPTPSPDKGEGEQEQEESRKSGETLSAQSLLSRHGDRRLGGEGFPDLAYVIYTSGSTGTPKGVLLSHWGLCNVVRAQQQVFQPNRTSRVLQFSSLSFDASIFEIALALGSGGTLYIPPQSAQLPGMALMQFLQEHAITHALMTPAVLAVLPSGELPNLQVLITGGEICSSQVIDRWAANRRFFNAYGPTETTIWATVAELHPGDNPLTIGRPILNTQVYILDAHLNPVPAGIPGELYIGGAGVAQGYLNRPGLTMKRFVSTDLKGVFSPTNKQQSTLYKTGDRVLYNRDGTIHFLGRIDHQIKIRGFRVELGEIETTLQRHPAIQDAVVIPSAASSLIAYFSLDTDYLKETGLRSLQTQHLQHWQTLYNQTYQSTGTPQHPEPSNPQFNITGWNSSYTGKPIPLEQMQEWVSDRVQQILALKPKRVLEIGCGTGLLLFQIAPHCQQYVGTDFSAVSLSSVQAQLDNLNFSHIELLQRIATDFEGIDLESFDVVILNSVVQYFPDEAYLMQVLEKAIATVAENGILFVGDVRNLALLPAFHSWMKFVQAEDGVERSQLWHQVERSQFEEPELAIDPAFFYALRSQFTQIRQVDIRLTRGHSQNEMTQFRYNVLLRVEQSRDVGFCASAQPTLAIRDPREQLDWKHHSVTVQETHQQLLAAEPEIFIITNVANSRVNGAVTTANWLQNKKAPKTVGRMREQLKDTESLAIDPQDWWNLETTLPYTVEITWSTSSAAGDYDVMLIRHGVDAAEDVLPHNERSPQPFTNYPLQANIARQLIPELRQYLTQALPDYMVPAAFVPLATLPLNSSGKVDRRALPPLDHAQHNDLPASNAPQTSTETALIEIWQELLQLKHVNRHDNFFESGGHSLLATQMTSRIRDTFKLELPLKNVFAAPTIAQLAPILDALRDTTPTTPPLVRLDRTAYRRKQSTLLSQPSQVISVPPQQETSLTLPPTSPLVPLALGGSEPPFFCVHPMFGVVFPYLELAHHLKSDRSFYGLQPLGLDGKSRPLNRMEAIAAYYIQAIQTLQPHGPYYLGGWSFGGLVAFEMAQQLTQAGEKVELLAIFDTVAPCTKPSFSQSFKFLMKTALWSTLPFLLDLGALATQRLQSQNSWFSRWQWSAITRLIPEESRLRLADESAINAMLPIVYANSQATQDYVPQPYSQAIALFKAAEQSDANQFDETLGWSELVKNIQLHEVPGNHLSLLKQPHVQILAQQLGHYLT